jgi:uncharacterized membrane protein YfcA
MQIPDLINGCFEILGAPFVCLSIIKLLKDKKVRGVSWKHITFFTSWGFWNLFYYPHLNQWCSFLGGLGIVITNLIWLGLILHYLRKKNE